MANLATWLRPCDEESFARFFARQPQLTICNAAAAEVDLGMMQGLLLTGGRDIAAEFLRQPVPDLSLIEKEVDSRRDAWEFCAIKRAMDRCLPILAICKGMQTLNVALGGTLHLDIAGHNDAAMRDHDVQELRTALNAKHRFERVNSSHHQAVDHISETFEVEAWSAQDGIIEQMRLRDYPFALAVQYHPERGTIYDALFEDFFERIN